MNASKAKRRLLRWVRYLDHTASVSTHKGRAHYHQGHAKAYTNYMTAGRYSPNGLRYPLEAWSRPGGA